MYVVFAGLFTYIITSLKILFFIRASNLDYHCIIEHLLQLYTSAKVPNNFFVKYSAYIFASSSMGDRFLHFAIIKRSCACLAEHKV